MAIKSARRLEKLPPYVFAVIGKKVAEMRAAGHDVIGLHVGSPDMPPPEQVVAALSSSAGDVTHHGYAGYSGTPGLREAIALYYSERFDVTLDPSTEVLPLIGSKEGLANLSMAYLDRGDIALVPDPGYPTYAMSAALADAEAYAYPLIAESNFLPDLEGIPDDVLSRARMLWINYPNNPTSAVATLEDFDA
ncbi:MAG: aminotransferase class I/II-fold pyridoxal phosphate-dependent enzyme, partial [Proteobacteria bacterium]|nr:aminotransferase class I/II-fold pyridoxal phosphate-dependent enzyme [Pseudomonadota bacterium]